MGNYIQLQNLVSKMVIDLPTAVQEEIPSLVNEAMRDLQNEHNYKVMEALVSAQQTVADTRTLLAKPANWKEWRDDPYFLDDTDGAKTAMTWFTSREAALEVFTNEEEGPPQALLISEPTTEAGAANIEVWPLSDSASDFDNNEYRIYIPYWKYLAALSADEDTNWLTVNAERAIVEYAVAKAFALDWDAEHEALHTQKAEVFRLKAQKFDKISRIMGVTTLVPHYRGVFSPRIRR